MYAHIFESPAQYRYDAGEKVMKLEPRLCERWENRAPDRWRFFLRPNLKFTNGEEINSEVAKFSMDTIKGNKGMASPFMAHVKEVVPVDQLTFDIVTEGPYAAPRPPSRSSGSSRPSTTWSPAARPASGASRSAAARTSSSSGRKACTSRSRPIRVLGPKPQIQAIIFRAQPESATRVALLDTGEADLITALPPELIDRAKRTADIRTARGLRRVYCFSTRTFPRPTIRWSGRPSTTRSTSMRSSRTSSAVTRTLQRGSTSQAMSDMRPTRSPATNTIRRWPGSC